MMSLHKKKKPGSAMRVDASDWGKCEVCEKRRPLVEDTGICRKCTRDLKTAADAYEED